MSGWGDIRPALRSRLLTVSSLPADHAWENDGFTPTSGVPYVSETLVPVSQRPVSAGLTELVATWQLTLAVPSGDGVAGAEDIIDDILAAFPPEADVGGSCRVVRSERSPAALDGIWYRMPVSIRVRAHGAY